MDTLLVIDVGNSNIVLGVFEGDRLLNSWRLATSRDRTAEIGRGLEAHATGNLGHLVEVTALEGKEGLEAGVLGHLDRPLEIDRDIRHDGAQAALGPVPHHHRLALRGLQSHEPRGGRRSRAIAPPPQANNRHHGGCAQDQKAEDGGAVLHAGQGQGREPAARGLVSGAGGG